MRERIPLLAFTVAGPMAHFRKFYSNTSALTYPFPPRTTVMGMIAGLLGMERDTYYEKLASSSLWIAVRMLVPVRIRTFTVNYLFTKNNALYNDKGAGTQIPVGWVLPRPPHRCLRYRIYVSTQDDALWGELQRVFSSRTFHWPPYLGLTEAVAWIEDILIGETPYGLRDEPVPLATPVLQHPELRLELDPGVRLLLDRFTLDFQERPYRSPRKVVDVVYEDAGKMFRARLPYPVFELPEESGIYGAFFREVSAVEAAVP